MEPRVRPEPAIGAVVLEAFAKLFAPRPKIYVFRALGGWQYATAEMPETHQVIMGVSVELYYAIDRHMMEQTGEQLRSRVDVQYVHEGHCVRILVPVFSPVTAMVDEFSPLIDAPPVIYLSPKPLGAA